LIWAKKARAGEDGKEREEKNQLLSIGDGVMGKANQGFSTL
jgi:hypothetical protein